MGSKNYCKLASRVLEIWVPYKTRHLKTRFLLAEFAKLDTFMPHRSRVFKNRVKKTLISSFLHLISNTQKKKKIEEYKPRKRRKNPKKEGSTNPRKEKKNPQQRRRPTAHTNPVSIKHIPIIDLWYNSRSPSPSKRSEQITHNS